MADVSSAKSMNVYHQAASHSRSPAVSEMSRISEGLYHHSDVPDQQQCQGAISPDHRNSKTSGRSKHLDPIFGSQLVSSARSRCRARPTPELSGENTECLLFFLRGPGGPDSLAQRAGTSVLPLSSSWVSSQMQDLFSGSHSMGGMEGEILAAG